MTYLDSVEMGCDEQVFVGAICPSAHADNRRLAPSRADQYRVANGSESVHPRGRQSSRCAFSLSSRPVPPLPRAISLEGKRAVVREAASRSRSPRNSRSRFNSCLELQNHGVDTTIRCPRDLPRYPGSRSSIVPPDAHRNWTPQDSSAQHPWTRSMIRVLRPSTQQGYRCPTNKEPQSREHTRRAGFRLNGRPVPAK